MFAKKISAVIIVFALLFNAGGLYFFVKFVHGQIRTEVREYVARLSDARLISFEKSFIEKNLRNGKIKFLKPDEFSFEGKLYDIIKTDTKDETRILVFEDNRETKFLSAVLGAKADDMKAFWQSLYNLLIKDAIFKQTIFFPDLPIFISDFAELKTLSLLSASFYISPFLSLNAPPPDFSC